MEYAAGEGVYRPGKVTQHERVSDYFGRRIKCTLDKPVILQLPVTFYRSQKVHAILEWCEEHLYHEYDHAFLGAIEGDDGEMLLHLVPEFAPNAWFFAFGDPDDATMFYLTWKGES